MFRLLSVVFFAFIAPSILTAEELPVPEGKILLTISGNIKNHNKQKTAVFDRKMLESFPVHSFATTTPWTEGITEFSGPKFSDIMKYVGANSNEFRAIALDKYEIDVSDIDFDNIPAIIAYTMNGKTMRVRDLGPLWVMFPFDQYPNTFTEKHKNASVWQLIELVIK